MADLAKILAELTQALRKKAGDQPVKELILKSTPEGSAVTMGGADHPFDHVFQDVGEFDRARGMLSMAFPDAKINQSHRIGDPAAPIFPQGAGGNSIMRKIATELPDHTPEEHAKIAQDLGDYMRTTGEDVDTALMNMLDDPDYNPDFDYPGRQEQINRLYDVTPTQPAKNANAVNRAYWPDLSPEERAQVKQFGREKKFHSKKLGRKFPR